MSIYSALNFDAPLIAYCALHQIREGVAPSDYEKTMVDLHRLVEKESIAINDRWETYKNDISAHIIQTRRGLMSQFLSTPLRSDSEEIDGIVRDGLAEYSKRVVPDHPHGVVSGTEGLISFNQTRMRHLDKLLALGKRETTAMGFLTRKGHPAIYESVFMMRGAMNLDVIEHIVRDRIGIYKPVHGKHITEFEAYAYTAYNMISLFGELRNSDKYEASLFFSKGDRRYAPFRKELADLLGDIQSDLGFSHISVWQRKLGLGAGKEFVIRIRCSDMKSVEKCFDKIAKRGQYGKLQRTLMKGNLLIKEMLKG